MKIYNTQNENLSPPRKGNIIKTNNQIGIINDIIYYKNKDEICAVYLVTIGDDNVKLTLDEFKVINKNP